MKRYDEKAMKKDWDDLIRTFAEKMGVNPECADEVLKKGLADVKPMFFRKRHRRVGRNRS